MPIPSALEEINIWRAPEAVLEQTFYLIKRFPETAQAKMALSTRILIHTSAPVKEKQENVAAK